MDVTERDAAADRLLGWGDLLGPEHRLATITLGLSVTLYAMNFFIFATLAPSVVADLGELERLHWATTLYVVASIVSSAAAGIIRARLGARRAVTLAILGFAAGAAGVGLAPTMTTVLAARALQGLGAGLLVANSHGLVRDLFPPASWARMFAAISGVWGIAALAGPLAGGIVATLGDWRLGFFAMLPVCIGLYLAVLRTVPAGGRRERTGTFAPILRLGLVGTAALAVAGAGRTDDAHTIALLAAASLLLAVTIVWERRTAEPLFPRSMFRPTTVLGAGVVFVFFASFGTVATSVYGPYLLQVLHGMTPITSGYIVTTQSLCWTAAALLVAGLSDRHARLAIAAGPVVIGTGCLGVALFLPGGPLWLVIAAIMMIGLGIGMAWGHVAKRVFDDAGESDRDRVSSVLPTTQSLGIAFGSAVAGIVADRAGLAGTPPVPVVADAARLVYLALLPAIGIAIAGASRNAFGRS